MDMLEPPSLSYALEMRSWSMGHAGEAVKEPLVPSDASS